MEKEFVSYEIAQQLKNLGFNESCLASWLLSGKERKVSLRGCGALLFDVDGFPNNTDYEDILCAAPLFQQVADWFRTKHKIYIFVQPIFDQTVEPQRTRFMPASATDDFDNYDSPFDCDWVKDDYYLCFNEAIEEAVKLISNG